MLGFVVVLGSFFLAVVRFNALSYCKKGNFFHSVDFCDQRIRISLSNFPFSFFFFFLSISRETSGKGTELEILAAIKFMPFQVWTV